MATLHTDVLNTLATATASLLTGGVFDADAIDIPSDGGWNWAKNEGLVSNMTLTPHGILRWKDSTAYQTEARHLGAEMEVAELFCYVEFGQGALLEQVVPLAKDAFPYGEVYQADDRSLYEVLFDGAYAKIPAEEYQKRPSRFIRFLIIHVR